MILGVGLLPPHVIPELAAPVALGALLLIVALRGSGRMRAPGPGVAWPLAALAVVLGLSVALSLQPLASIRVVVTWLGAAVTFVAARSLGPEAEARRTARTIVLAATLLAALGIYQSTIAFPGAAAIGGGPAAEGSPPSSAKLAEARGAEFRRLESGRAVGTLGFPAALASILILSMPLACAAALGSRGVPRVLWMLAALFQGLALLATRSIGGAGALVAGAGLASAAWTEIPARRRRVILLVVLVTAALVAAPRLPGSGDLSAGRSAALRLENWRACASMIAAHPMLGVGPGNFGLALPAHRTWASNETQHVHNSFLEAVSDAGLPIAPLLLLALAAFGGWVRAEPGRTEGDASARWLHRGLAIGCLAWLAQNAVDFTAYLAATSIPFMGAAGLLAASAERAREASGGHPIPASRRAGFATASVLLALSLLAVMIAIPDALARRHLERAVDAAAARDFESARIEAARSVALDPMDPEARVVLSQSLIDAVLHRPAGDPARAELLDRAVVEAEEGVRLDPSTANRRAALAMARAAVGDAAGAFASMAAAARLNAFKPEYAEERDRMLGILTTGIVPGERGPGGSP